MSGGGKNQFSSNNIETMSIAFVNDDTFYDLQTDVSGVKWVEVFVNEDSILQAPPQGEEIRLFIRNGVIDKEVGILSQIGFDGAGRIRALSTLLIPLSESIFTLAPTTYYLSAKSFGGDSLNGFSITFSFGR
jgi:hypothetical protein